MAFLEEILTALQAMTHDDDCHAAADEQLVNMILFLAGALSVDFPEWNAKAFQIVAAYRKVPR